MKVTTQIECERHPELFNLMTKAHDTSLANTMLLEFQQKTIDQILAIQSEQGKQIEATNRIVTNGLSNNIVSIKESMMDFKKTLEGFMERTGKKIDEFDEFSWFRKGINKVRDNSILVGFLIFSFLVISHFSSIVGFFGIKL